MNEILQIKKRIDKCVRRFNSQRNLGSIAKKAAKIVVKRTRLGFGVAEENGTKKKLKRLSDSYKESRKKSKKLNRGRTSAGKSNLTFTGQLLDSIKGEYVSAGRIAIFATENRDDNKVDNIDIVKFQAAQGRAFLNMSESENRQVARISEKFMRKCLNIELKKLK